MAIVRFSVSGAGVREITQSAPGGDGTALVSIDIEPTLSLQENPKAAVLEALRLAVDHIASRDFPL